MQTPEQQKGTRFEIWLELLLKRLGYQNLLRNIEYRKEEHENGIEHPRRQVDLRYNLLNNGRIYLALVEAKYTSNGNMPYALRNGEAKKSQQQIPRIDNLVDEVWERQQFVGADMTCLVTNHGFDVQVKEESKKKGIRIIEGRRLAQFYRQLGGKESIDDSIDSIDTGKYNLHKNIIYIP